MREGFSELLRFSGSAGTGVGVRLCWPLASNSVASRNGSDSSKDGADNWQKFVIYFSFCTYD